MAQFKIAGSLLIAFVAGIGGAYVKGRIDSSKAAKEAEAAKILEEVKKAHGVRNEINRLDDGRLADRADKWVRSKAPNE